MSESCNMLTDMKGDKKYRRNQTPGLALQSIPWDKDLELVESMPRQEVRRADETAECNGRSDCTQPSSATDLNGERNS
jgi:hypothetical protein